MTSPKQPHQMTRDEYVGHQTAIPKTYGVWNDEVGDDRYSKKLSQTDQVFEKVVRRKMAEATPGAAWPFPPVVVSRQAGSYDLKDGHHRIEVAKRLGVRIVPAVLTDPKAFGHTRPVNTYVEIGDDGEPRVVQPNSETLPPIEVIVPETRSGKKKPDHNKAHRAAVKAALAAGKPVPPEVLADYPEMAPKPSPPPAPKPARRWRSGADDAKPTAAEVEAASKPATAPAPLPVPAAKNPAVPKPAKTPKAAAPASPPPPASPAAKADVPAGHTVEHDHGGGVVTTKDPKTGDLTTRFPAGVPEAAAAKYGKAVMAAHEEARFDPDYEDGLVPLGVLVAEARRQAPDATAADVLAALSHMRKTRVLQGQALNEVQRLTDGSRNVVPLDGGRTLAGATLWDNGRALHYWIPPRD